MAKDNVLIDFSLTYFNPIDYRALEFFPLNKIRSHITQCFESLSGSYS